MATVTYPGEASPAPAGAVITVSFLLDGQEYTAVNASVVQFDETLCFLILCPPGRCRLLLWSKLSQGG